MTTRKTLVATILGASVCAAVAANEPVVRVAFNIQPQPIGRALTDLGEQAGLQVLVRGEDSKGGQALSRAVSGELTVRAALERILANSGLAYEFLDERTVRVRAIDANPTSRERIAANADDETKPGGQRSPLGLAQSRPRDQEAVASEQATDRTQRNQTGTPTREDLQEVIVTAQKRSEKLMDVPASLTAISAASLQTQGVLNFSDYMTLVPSLSDFSGGSQGHGAVILRGLNSGYMQTSNTVGYYVDDIPFSATSPLSVGALLTPDPDLTDIDHLEVLKGPQATLYGASTLGGLIKTVTKKPNLDEYSGEVQLDGSTIDHGGSGYGVVGIANVPLIPGQLALRVSGFNRDFPGYTTNTTLGTKDRGLTRKK